MAYNRTDIILMEVLQDCKTITGFLDAVFGFLRRNTDFYYIQDEAAYKVGFARGVRERIVVGALHRYDPECTPNRLAAEDTGSEISGAPPAVEEVEVETIKLDEPSDTLIEPQQPAVEPLQQTIEPLQPAIEPQQPAVEPVPTSSSADEQRSCFATNDYKNGACFDNYCWSQTLSEVELHVKLPPELQSAKLLYVEIQPHKICVRSKLNPEHVVLCGQLQRFKHNDTVWTVTEGKLLISLDKLKEKWWPKLFEDELPIDMQKIDCERYIDELPESSQAAIHKLRVEQQMQDAQNELQSSTSDSAALERLGKAWDAEGSPFKGQPFDPSLVEFS